MLKAKITLLHLRNIRDSYKIKNQYFSPGIMHQNEAIEAYVSMMPLLHTPVLYANPTPSSLLSTLPL